jgi:hypothetical protein
MPASGPLSWFFSSQTAVNSRNVVRSIRRSNALSAALPLRGRFDARSVASRDIATSCRSAGNVRDGPKDQTSDVQLHIGESRDSGFTLRAPRNDVSFDRSDVTFTTGAKNLKLASQYRTDWEMIPTDVSRGAFHSN